MQISRVTLTTILLSLLAAGALLASPVRVVVRATCIDGILPMFSNGSEPALCDADGTPDGICTFSLLSCVERHCDRDAVTVRARHRRVVIEPNLPAGAIEYLLRCRHHLKQTQIPS